MTTFSPARFTFHLTGWSLSLVILSLATVLIQPGSATVSDWIHWFQTGQPESLGLIWTEFRLPRLIAAGMTGGALAVSGLILQLMLRNPLAEPYILGISSGASLGAILPLLLGVHLYFIQAGGAFLGAVIVSAVVFRIGYRFGVLDTGRLLLGGVMMSALLSAVIFLALHLTGDSLRIAITWLMGNLSLADPDFVWPLLPVILLFLAILMRYAWSFNLLLTGEAVARQSGVPVERLKRVAYLCVSAMTGLCVATSGIIGFTGLVIPHILRIFYGNDHRFLIPVSFLAGGLFLIVSDWIARSLLYPSELPVGAITALIGAPYFIYLLIKKT